MKKEICRHLAIKFIMVSFLVSCKTSNVYIYKDKENYKVINKVLESYFLENDKAYLHPKIITRQDYIIQNFKKERGYYGRCNRAIIHKVFAGEDFSIYKNQNNEIIAWNYKHIENPKVVTELKINSPSGIKRFEAHKKSIKDKYDLLDRKYLIWTSENDGSLIRLSLPFFSNKGIYASVFMSKTHHGTSLWILEKKNRKWEVVCNMELSVY